MEEYIRDFKLPFSTISMDESGLKALQANLMAITYEISKLKREVEKIKELI